MNASGRRTSRLLVALFTAAAFGSVVVAAPAAAEPTDSGVTGPASDASDVLPVARVLEGMWSAYVPRDAAPPAHIGAVDQFFEQFVPTTTQVGDFFAFLQQFRPPAMTMGPIG